MHYNFMANANTRIAEPCYKQGSKEEFHRSTLSTSPSSVFPYAVVQPPSRSVHECWYYRICSVLIFSRHKRLWLVDNPEWQEENVLVDREGEVPGFVSYHLFQWLQ